MKTKLLKRLRKQAKRKYFIKKNHYGYYVCIRIDLDLDLDLFFDTYTIAVSCRDIESARNTCNTARRRYILSEVRSMRNKNFEILDF